MTKEQLILLLKKYKENKSKLRLKLREKERGAVCRPSDICRQTR